MIFSVDFDGTCVVDAFPNVGEDVKFAPNVLKLITSKGHKIILFTCRCDSYRNMVAGETGSGTAIQKGMYLTAAIDWFKSHDIPLWGVNENPEQTFPDASPKPFATYYIDDKNVGCPLTIQKGKKVVDWKRIYVIIKANENF
jgi:hypothetical protein